MKTAKFCLILLVGVFALCACNQASLGNMTFPEWPEEDVYTYDTFNIKCVPQAISVKTAISIGKKLPSKGSTPERYYVKGIVKKFNEPKHTEGMTGTYRNALVYIQDNPNTDLEYYGYQIYGIDSAKFQSMDQLKIGDTIVILGKIYNYSGTVETEARGVAYMYYSSNELAYPEGDFDYYKENFKTDLGEWTQLVIDDPGVNVWKQNKTTAGATSAIAQAVGAQNAKLKSEVWLVSPEIDLDIFNAKNVKLYFTTYYQGSPTAGTVAPAVQDLLLLKVRKEGKDWTSITIPHFNTGKLPSYVSDTIDISAYVGEKTQIAFAYKSTTNFAPKWSISSIRLSERKRVKPCQ